MDHFQIQIQVGGKVFADVLAGFASLANAFENGMDDAALPVSAELRKALQLVANVIVKEHSGPWNGGVVNSSSKLQSRSGTGMTNMKNSIRSRGNGSMAGVQGQISTGVWAIHETGGTIRAKSSGYLTIPLPAAMDSRGVPLKKRARDWQNTFVARSRKGNLIIFQKKNRKTVTPLYILKPEVTIKPRLRMEHTIMATGVPYFERKALQAIETALLKRIYG